MRLPVYFWRDNSIHLVITFKGAFTAMSEFKPTLSEEERAYARSIRLMLEPFRSIRPTMPLQYLHTFLLVCEHEGKGVSEYAQLADVAPTVMTRHLLDIGDRNRHREEGFGLVSQIRDAFDLRRHHSKITAFGKATLHKMVTAMKTAPGFRGGK